MSNYFSYFPTTANDLTQTNNFVNITNILRRFKFRSSISETLSVFYDYTIQNGDRPDTISEKYYGDSKYAWVVLHFNNIIDPFFGWPLFDENYNNYIEGKYGSIATAQATVHEYRKILNNSTVLYDGTIIPKRYIVVDETTYNATGSASRELVTKYDYENEVNEAKRKIKILDNRYLPQVRTEVENILRNGV